ncbi:MAG TPA: DUF1028 domain-containing protein [Bacteroidales bacterium]
MKKHLLVLVLSVAISFISTAQDTFSIVAIDTITGEVGSAGASCIDENGIPGGVIVLSDVHPGVGAIHTQAYWLAANQAYAKQLMNDGLSPQQIIDSVVANDAQNNPTRRQYGIVDFRDGVVRSAAYTGVNCNDYKNHIVGPNYSIQGNILLGQEILDSMESRFLNTEGELICRLMAALQGAKVVGADTRCFAYGTSSLSAFARVAKPDDPVNDLYLDFNVPSVVSGVDPIDSLQVLVDAWGGCLGVGIEESVSQTTVFPNPAENKITFQTASGINTLRIFDIMGKEVFSRKNIDKSELSVDVSHFTQGVYSFQINSFENKLISGSFIVH